MKRLLLLVALLFASGAAYAACPVVPFVFPPTSINPTQVNTNFESLRTCINSVSHGSVFGPAATTINELALWNDTTGTLVKDGLNQSVVHSFAFPSSFGSTPTKSFSVNVGGFAGKEMPAGTMSGITSSMSVPVTYTEAPWPPTNYSAYMLNGNTQSGNSAVSYFSIGGTTQTGSSIYGVNNVLGNTIDPVGSPKGAGLGLDFGLVEGSEINFNIRKKGSTAPAGSAYAYLAAGDSETRPTGRSIAYYSLPLGMFTTPLTAWESSFESGVGAALIGLNLQAKAAGVGQDSQPIVMNSVDGAGVQMHSTLLLDSIGNQIVQVGKDTAGFLVEDTAGRALFSAIGSSFTAANWVNTAAAPTGVAPVIEAVGGDTDVGLTINAKGAGTVDIASVLRLTGIVTAADCTAQPSQTVIATTGTGVLLLCP